MSSFFKKKAQIARPSIVLIGFVVLVVALVCICGDREPSFDGKALSYWIGELKAECGEGPASAASSSLSADALRRIGPAAKPYLLKWLIATPPSFNNGVEQLTLQTKIRDFAVGLFRRFRRTNDPQPESIVLTFRVLGPDAKWAITDLVTIAKQSSSSIALHDLQLNHKGLRNEELLELSAKCLSCLGSEAVIPLLEVATNLQGHEYQWVIVEQIGNMRSSARPAIPALINWLHDSNDSVREHALLSLGKIALEPETVITNIAISLNDHSFYVQKSAIYALKQFENSDKSSDFYLVRALNNPDLLIRIQILRALESITGESAISFLTKELKGGNDETRRIAAISFGDLKDQAGVPALVGALDDPVPSVHAAVVNSLKRLDLQARVDQSQ